MCPNLCTVFSFYAVFVIDLFLSLGLPLAVLKAGARETTPGFVLGHSGSV